MKTIVCEQTGPPENLVIRDNKQLAVGDDDVLVDMKAAAVSFVDLLMVTGEYHIQPEMPFVPGHEGAGIVSKTGKNVTDVKVDDRVMTSHSPGSFTEQAVLPASSVAPIPDNMDFAQAASFRSSFMTAFMALQRGQLKAGDVLLVHGAAGGVGLAAVQVGKLWGATVIATASTDEKLKIVKQLGADHTINYSHGFRDQVKELTDGKGADVTYDPVGGDVFDESMRCINYRGRILIIGFTAGRPAHAKTNHLLVKDVSVIGMTLDSFSRHEPAAAQKNFEELMHLVATGKLTPHVSHRLPLEQVAKAMNIIKNREVIGKVVLEIS